MKLRKALNLALYSTQYFLSNIFNSKRNVWSLHRWAREMAQLVKEFITQVCWAEFNPWNPQWKERTNCLKSCPLSSHMHVMASYTQTHTHTHTTHIHKLWSRSWRDGELSDQEHLLILQRIRVWYPAPTWHLTTIYNITSVPGDPTPSLSVHGHQACKGYTDVRTGKTPINILF